MSNQIGLTDRPYRSGKGALVAFYGFGICTAFLLIFLAVASKASGGIGPMLAATPLLFLAITMNLFAVAALGSLVVAIVQAYNADTVHESRGGVDLSWTGRPARAADPEEATDPWAGTEVAPETDRLTAGDLAPAGR